MGPKTRLSRWWRWLHRLLVAPVLERRRNPCWQLADGGRLLASARTKEPPSQGHPLLFSPGYGAALGDYARLAELFGQRQPVYRAHHQGSDRGSVWALLPRFFRTWWSQGHTAAALAARSQIHALPVRKRRQYQLEAALRKIQQRTGARKIDLAGHSFGTDTALMLALIQNLVEIDTLYLFSPHPPGYLIEKEQYSQLAVRRVVVVVGSRDYTRDGVGPQERLQVMEYLPSGSQAIVLPGVAHMDFAFSDLGPKDWPTLLGQALWPELP